MSKSSNTAVLRSAFLKNYNPTPILQSTAYMSVVPLHTSFIAYVVRALNSHPPSTLFAPWFGVRIQNSACIPWL